MSTAITNHTETLLDQTKRLVGNVNRMIDSQRDEIALLRAENEDLRERLEVATAPPVDPHPDRILWTFYFRDADIERVTDALQSTGDATDADKLARICREWMQRKDYDRRICEAAKATRHAGIEHLAVDANWFDIFSDLADGDPVMLVQQIAATRDAGDLQRLLEEWGRCE